jgi:hypothetical protein
MDELVDCLTKPKFAQKLVVILAGYDKDIDRLMSMNPGLTSRFPETIIFKPMELETCVDLLSKVLVDLQKKNNAPLDLAILTPPSPYLKQQLLELFGKLSVLESWGNARDVKTLAKGMFQTLISTAVPPITTLVLTEAIVTDIVQEMLEERTRRNAAVGAERFPGRRRNPQPQPKQQGPPPAQGPNIGTGTSTGPAQAPPSATNKKGKLPDHPKATQKKPDPAEEPEDPLDAIFKAKRDPGVSDEDWEQLERDKHAMVAKEREYRRLQDEIRQEEERIKDLIRAEQAAADEEERRVREQARIAAELERRRRAEELAATEKQRQMEMERQQKLRVMGLCPMGYQWIKHAGGYQCAGGAHLVSDAAINAFCR